MILARDTAKIRSKNNSIRAGIICTNAKRTRTKHQGSKQLDLRSIAAHNRVYIMAKCNRCLLQGICDIIPDVYTKINCKTFCKIKNV